MAINCKVAEKGGDRFLAHLRRVTLIVKEDKAANPIDVSLFRADAVAFDPKVPADAIEKFSRPSAGGRSRIFRDPDWIAFGDDGKANRDRLPPVVNPSRLTIPDRHLSHSIKDSSNREENSGGTRRASKFRKARGRERNGEIK
jgi:hypothetical protein